MIESFKGRPRNWLKPLKNREMNLYRNVLAGTFRIVIIALCSFDPGHMTCSQKTPSRGSNELPFYVPLEITKKNNDSPLSYIPCDDHATNRCKE